MYSDLIGKPYREFNEPKGQGKYDCWDLASECMKRHGYDELPNYLDYTHDKEVINKLMDDGKVSNQWIEVEKQPNVLVLFKPRLGLGLCGHIGFYLGDDLFIHSAPGMGVCIERLDGLFWRRRIEGFYLPRKEG